MRVCIFCQRKASTREDVWPQWLARATRIRRRLYPALDEKGKDIIGREGRAGQGGFVAFKQKVSNARVQSNPRYQMKLTKHSERLCFFVLLLKASAIDKITYMATEEEIKKQVRKKSNIIDRLQGYAVRTFRQLLIHSLVAVLLAAILGFVLSNCLSVSVDNFVAIISSTSAASGALLAVSLALATFWARHVTDWRDRLINQLNEDRERLAIQMQNSAKSYPEISRRLAELYLKFTFYIPGQTIDMEEMHSARKVFDDWAKEQAKKSPGKFDFGNLNTYESFAKHLFDASLRSNAMSQTLTQLHVAEVAGRSIITFSPLIITWVIIVIFTLVFAIIGGMSVIPEYLNLPILLAPFYLFLIAIFALTKDVTAILRNMRILETGYEQAMAEFANIRETLT